MTQDQGITRGEGGIADEELARLTRDKIHPSQLGLGDILGMALRGEITPAEAHQIANACTSATLTRGSTDER